MMNKEIAILDKDYEIAAVYNGGIAGILEDITIEAAATVFDMETVGGRAGAASMAHKVSKSKVALDNLGKGLVKEWKDKAKTVDAERKLVRDTLDDLRDKVRAPLTKWEADKAEAEAREILAKQVLDAHEEALGVDSLINRERAIAAKEIEQAAAKEAERLATEQREKDAAQAAELERKTQQARADAEQQAKDKIKAAEDAAQAKIKAADDAAQLKIDQAQQKVEEEAQKRIDDKRKAEQQKLDAVRETEERLAREQEEKAIAERKDAERLRAEIARENEAAEKAAQSLSNKRKVNKAALDALVSVGITAEDAKKVVTAIAKGKIPKITINY